MLQNRKRFFVKWHIKLHRLFNAKLNLIEEYRWYYWTHLWKNKGVHAFPKGISLKLNVITQKEFELAYYKASVQHFSNLRYDNSTVKSLIVRRRIWIEYKYSPVSWGCRIHQVPLRQRVSLIRHYQFRWQSSSNVDPLGNAEYPFIAGMPSWCNG